MSIFARGAFIAVAFIVCVASGASAQRRALGPGLERDVLALLAPYGLGDDVGGGYRLWGVRIEQTLIRLTLRAADGSETTATLTHHDDAPAGASRTQSFALVRLDETPAADASWARVFAAVEANDRVDFWVAASTSVHSVRRWNLAQTNFMDGALFIVLLWLLAIGLASRLLTGAPRWMGAVLAAIVAAGLIVRLLESPVTFLGAWPWTRLYPHMRAVIEGDLLAWWSERSGQTFYVTDVSFSTSLVYAALMPLVLFSHGTFLLRDPRGGLAAAFAIAFLPQHIRFSRCEDGFIGSLVLTSLAFALIHGWLRDRSRVARAIYIIVLPFVLYPGYLLRPLNILFIVVYAAALVALHTETAPLWRRIVGLCVVAVVGAAAVVRFLAENGQTASNVTQHPLEWMLSAVVVTLDPRLLVLSDPTRTPPVLFALAILGGITLYRAGERRLLVFLVGWLGLFVVAHAVVVERTMEPRYHLHLVVPFLLLGASGIPKVIEAWREGRRRGLIALGVTSLAFAPLIHIGFVQDRDYVEIQEYEAVRAARDVVPEGCTVLEITGGELLSQLRFARIGAVASNIPKQRYEVVPYDLEDRTGASRTTLDGLMRNPPACLYVYEGIPCSLFTRSGEAYASECTEVRERLDAQTVILRSAPNVFYDPKNQSERGVRGDRIPLRVSRSRLGGGR